MGLWNGVWENRLTTVISKLTNLIVRDTFTYLNAGGEQTIFEITSQVKTYIDKIMLDLNNLTKNGTIKIYSKIDNVTYRQLEFYTFTVLTDPKGLLLDLKIPAIVDFKITYEEETDEGLDRDIPFSYVLGN